MLPESRDKLDTIANDDTGNLEWLMRDNRKHPTGDEIMEKTTEDLRENSTSQVITEKAMNKAGDEGLNKKRDNSGIPLQDMALQYEKDFIKAFAKDNKEGNLKKKEDRFPTPGSQLLGDGSNKVKVTQRSQLLSNFDSREEFQKENPFIRNSLKTADAMIYHIYRKAFVDGREISENDKKIIGKINDEKRIILSQVQDWGEEYAGEQLELQGEKLEDKVQPRVIKRFRAEIVLEIDDDLIVTEEQAMKFVQTIASDIKDSETGIAYSAVQSLEEIHTKY
jgi:hypothetical protein